MSTDAYYDVGDLPETNALPRRILRTAIQHLPNRWATHQNGHQRIVEALAASYLRVVSSDFTKTCWSLLDPNDVKDTIHWCMLGGSFLADFGMDATKPRIFGWGLSPIKEPAYFALNQLKGRDADSIPTAVCAPVDKVRKFIAKDQLDFGIEIITDFLRMAPTGVRIPANGEVPDHFVSTDGLVQFIIAGVDSPFMNLVEQYLDKTGYPLMGVTSGNLSGKGQFAARNRGTHKNIDEIQTDMGRIGIPILAGALRPQSDNANEHLSIHRRYHMLNDPYERMPRDEFASSTDLLPLSVTVCQPIIEDGRQYFDVVRHGSTHVSAVSERLLKYDVEVRLRAADRLEISRYERTQTA